MKITFMGAGSTVFARSVLGDCICTDAFRGMDIALYDIDRRRLEESETILSAINRAHGNPAVIRTFCGPERRLEALDGADFVVNAIQVGGYEPCTVTDFEIPKKYGLRQTIADTLGIGGIMRGLRTIPVLESFARDMERACPNAWFLNYTNPMSILTGYMLRYTGVKTVGLCHSVQVCSEGLLKSLDGKDLYPEVRRRAAEKNRTTRHPDMVRFDYIEKLGYYCTESSEHNAEYNPYYIKARYPELIERFQIPLDEYPRRCVRQIDEWEREYASLSGQAALPPENAQDGPGRHAAHHQEGCGPAYGHHGPGDGIDGCAAGRVHHFVLMQGGVVGGKFHLCRHGFFSFSRIWLDRCFGQGKRSGPSGHPFAERGLNPSDLWPGGSAAAGPRSRSGPPQCRPPAYQRPSTGTCRPPGAERQPRPVPPGPASWG